MGLLLGLVFGIGALLVLLALTTEPTVVRSPRPRTNRLAASIAEAGLEGVTPRGVVLTSAGLAVLVGLSFYVLTETWPIALAFATIAALTPTVLIRQRVQKRRAELREVWPDVVDNLASAVRAGMSLPEALGQLGARGPQSLRRHFARFADDYRTTGRFTESLDALKDRLADPTGDRIVESLRIAREVGGSDLGRLLRTLSAFLRDELRVRTELETRQGWVTNAAKLAVAGPWILLALLSFRSTSIQAYQQPSGVMVLAVGAAVSVVAYRVMVRLGRLPEDERVLR
ncbi:MAG: type II secretion system F family protein [Jiangellales bacterium]